MKIQEMKISMIQFSFSTTFFSSLKHFLNNVSLNLASLHFDNKKMNDNYDEGYKYYS
jgi:hypothetical protein